MNRMRSLEIQKRLACIERNFKRNKLTKGARPTSVGYKPKQTRKKPQMEKVRVNPFTGASEISRSPTLDVLYDLKTELEIILGTFSIERGFSGQTVSVTTTPVKIIDGKYPRVYRIQNAATAVGITSSGTVLASGSRGAGNTQANSLGVAAHKDLRLFLDVTVAGSGDIVVNTQTKDPVSGNWIVVQQDIFGAATPTPVGTYYANIGSDGVDSDFAVSYTLSGTDATFSIGYVLKEGLGGSGTGLNRTIYFGTNSGLTASNGFPILEGGEQTFYTKPNTELWAVSNVSTGVDLKIFELQ